MNDKLVGRVYETTNYNKFKLVDTNREIRISPKQRKNFSEYGVIAPIIVNEDMQIIDGQHRWAYAKENFIPIKYFISNGLNDEHIIAMNTTQESWLLGDFIESYAKSGISDYIKLIPMLSETYAPKLEFISTAADRGEAGGNLSNIVKNGGFMFKNYNSSKKYLVYFNEIINETGLSPSNKMCTAIHTVSKAKNFNEKRLIQKIQETNYKEEIEKMNRNYSSLVLKIIEVYNYKLSDSSPSFIDYVVDSKGKVKILT